MGKTSLSVCSSRQLICCRECLPTINFSSVWLTWLKTQTGSETNHETLPALSPLASQLPPCTQDSAWSCVSEMLALFRQMCCAILGAHRMLSLSVVSNASDLSRSRLQPPWIIYHSKLFKGLPRWLSGKESACQCQRHKRSGFDPWVGKIPGVGNDNRGAGRRCSPWACKESGTTEATEHSLTLNCSRAQ